MISCLQHRVITIHKVTVHCYIIQKKRNETLWTGSWCGYRIFKRSFYHCRTAATVTMFRSLLTTMHTRLWTSLADIWALKSPF